MYFKCLSLQRNYGLSVILPSAEHQIAGKALSQFNGYSRTSIDCALCAHDIRDA